MLSIDNPLPLLRKKHESPVSAVLQQASASLCANRTHEAMDQCQRALTISRDLVDICGFALAHAHKSLVHSLLKQHREAERAIEEASRCLHFSGERHNEAVSYLIDALIHYQAGTLEEARSAYETGRDCMERLRHRASAAGHEIEATEYSTLIEEIGQRLEQIAQAIAGRYAPPADGHAPVTNQHIPSPIEHAFEDSVHFLPVIGPITASRATISTDDIQKHILATVEQVTIDGDHYHIKRIRGKGSVIKLNRHQYDYYLSRVTGNSMDQAVIDNHVVGINEGDYVVLARSRDIPVHPDSGDIVAASIIDMDAEVTLKRYIKQGDTIILQPESSNPEHKPYEFHKGDEGVNIVAVTIAVLKPIE